MTDPFYDKRDPLVKVMERSAYEASVRAAVEDMRAECERIARAHKRVDFHTAYGLACDDIANAILILKDR